MLLVVLLKNSSIINIKYLFLVLEIFRMVSVLLIKKCYILGSSNR